MNDGNIIAAKSLLLNFDPYNSINNTKKDTGMSCTLSLEQPKRTWLNT